MQTDPSSAAHFENEDLVVHYQPIVETSRLEGSR